MRWILTSLLLTVASTLSAQNSPTWRLVEELRIGSVDGAMTLNHVTKVIVSPDREAIYVTQRSVNSIWSFDAKTGRKLREIGRGGSGPGEFSRLLWIGWRADSVYATDSELNRVTLFSSEGEYLRSEQNRYPVVFEGSWGSFPIAFTREGTIAQTRSELHEQAEGKIASHPLFLLDEEGRILRTLAELDVRNTWAAAAVGRGVMFFAQPMSQRTFYGLEPFGSSMVIVRQPAGNDPPGRFQVARIRINGDTIYSHSYRYTPQPVSRELADSLYAPVTRSFSRLASFTPERAREAARQHVIIPAYQPPFSNSAVLVIVSPGGSAWLRREDLGQATVRWLVLNPEGMIEANAVAPTALRILHADRDTVWGTVTGEFDEPYIVRYRIQR